MSLSDGLRLRYLHAMGVQTWVRRDAQPNPRPVTSGVPDVPAGACTEVREIDGATDVASLDWTALAHVVSHCTACDLHRGRTQTVFARGDREAAWMVIGEGPGAEEDRQGEPFVGRAGKLLDEMLLAAGFPRGSAYIANIVKCRPPGNRDPRPEEAASCAPYLARQIALVQPRLILAVGRVAAQRLLRSETPVGKLRGKVHHYGENPQIPVVVTYHPAYLLRAPREKRKVWQDLQYAMRVGAGAS